jgi:anthranilate synthase/aminodeoxychorismate synthase-like glutamine amidotransferase
MLLLLDNYDSFTYNLQHYFIELGIEVCVHYNDALSLKQIEQLQPSAIVISPGPGKPQDAGISLAVIKHFFTRLPILGVCLGHQAIAYALGARIIPAPVIMHGKTSLVTHCNTGLFADLPQPLQVTRYHSLAIEPTSLPPELTISAWTETNNNQLDTVMGIAHRHYPVVGVQFHPEAVLTQAGHQLLANFLKLSHTSHF